MAAANKNQWAHIKPKYDVKKEAYTLTQRLSEVGGNRSPLDFPTIEEAREHDRHVISTVAGNFEFDGSTVEMKIPYYSFVGQQEIRTEVYTPNSSSDTAPIWVYFHGGGLIFGCCETYRRALQMIAEKSGAVVMSVEYRLLPLPEDTCAPIDDAIAVTKWALENKKLISGSDESKLGIGGDSSGGYLVACVTHEILNLDFQILVYPLTDTSRSQASLEEFADDPVIPRWILDWSFNLTIGQMPEYLTNQRINPMARTNLHRSPPALFIVSELDPFRDGAIEYSQKLSEHGVDVRVDMLKGIPHFFFNFPDIFPTTCGDVYGEISAFIQSH